MLSTERRRHDVHVSFGDVTYDVRNAHWRVNNKKKKKINSYFIVSGEISVYLVKIKMVSITSELRSYHFTSD